MNTKSEESRRDDQRISTELAGLDRHTDPFVAAVHATRMPMIITNPRLPDNPVVFANDSFCRLSGYTRDEIVGRNCRFLQGPETDPETVRRIHDAVARVEAIEIDIRNHRKDGEPFWNRLLMAPVHDVDGQLVYFFASQVDVTIERERLAGLETDNAALMAEVTTRLRMQQERERELDFALRAGRFGTWSLNLQDNVLSSSDQCKALFGLSPETPFTQADRLAAVLPEDRQRTLDALANTIGGNAEYEVEYRIRTPDSAVRWLASRGQAFSDAAGRPLRLAGVSLDITAVKRAERRRLALAGLGDMLRDLADAVDISAAAAEVIGRTLEVSRAGYGAIDTKAETITIDRDWNAEGVVSIAGTLSFRNYGSYIDDIKRGDTAVVQDARTDPRTAATAPALEAISARSFINMPVTEQGKTVALVFVNHDVPREWPPEDLAFLRDVAERTRTAVERRLAERRLADLAASLEEQVAARTAELITAQEALRQSQKMEAVGQLTGGIAHDFNNLLTGITGNIELLQARAAQGRYDTIERYAGAAFGAAQRAAALTQRLLAFSRRQTLDPKPTDVNRLVVGMDDLIRRAIGPMVHLEVVGAGGLWPTLIDASQLENALLNLCINARDAMPDGGRITIETGNKWLDTRGAVERDLPPGQYVSLCVTDTGTGMAPEVIARAFDPFFTTKPLGAGTGLGLSMIYGFVRQSGGQVRIYSEVGQGTTMCLYLPRHHGEGVLDEDATPTKAELQAREGETVLIVDDEPTIRQLVAEVLGEAGFGVLEAADGPAGLKLLESSARIDLLVTDVGLPGGMNGRQVADAGRALRPGLKVLFITGYAENAAVGNGHLEPGMALLTKPFAMDDLATRIRQMIEASD